MRNDTAFMGVAIVLLAAVLVVLHRKAVADEATGAVTSNLVSDSQTLSNRGTGPAYATANQHYLFPPPLAAMIPTAASHFGL